MIKKEKTENLKFLSVAIFTLYLIILVWALLFKLEFSAYPYIQSINLIPYAEPAIANSKVDIIEIIMNIAAFIPFGLFVSILKPDLKFGYKLLPIIIATVLIELFQYIWRIGASDITDVLNNVAGGIIGIVLYKLLFRLLGNKTNKILLVILTICLILLSALIAVVKIANM